MWSHSLPPSKQPSESVAYAQQFGDFISRHKYSTAIALCLILLAATIVVVFMQRSADHPDNNAQAVTVEQEALPANAPVDETTSVGSAPTTASSESASTSTEYNSQNGQALLKVNNQEIPIPKNGSVNRTVPSNDGSGSVNVSVNSSSSGSGTNNSSSSTSIQTTTSSDISVENSE